MNNIYHFKLLTRQYFFFFYFFINELGQSIFLYTCRILDPLAFGDYPPEMRHILGSELPRFSPRERKLLEGSLDFIGINHYSTLYAKDRTQSACTDGEDRPIQGFVNTTGYRDGVAIGGLVC